MKPSFECGTGSRSPRRDLVGVQRVLAVGIGVESLDQFGVGDFLFRREDTGA
jgi:hypothetical protein